MGYGTFPRGKEDFRALRDLESAGAFRCKDKIYLGSGIVVLLVRLFFTPLQCSPSLT